MMIKNMTNNFWRKNRRHNCVMEKVQVASTAFGFLSLRALDAANLWPFLPKIFLSHLPKLMGVQWVPSAIGFFRLKIKGFYDV